MALDTFSIERKNDPTLTTPFAKPDYSRYLAGLSIGGPIVRDKLFFFGAYEGNFQDRTGVTRLNGTPASWPAIIAPFNNDAHTAPFRGHSGFAKFTYNLSPTHLLEFTGDGRIESETRGFGNQFSGAEVSFQSAFRFKNDVVTGRIKDTYFGRGFTNEALVSYQWYRWNQDPLDFNTPGQNYVGIGRIGGNDSYQNLQQKRLSFRNDLTLAQFRWAGAHIVKFGGNVDFLNYDMNKNLNGNPVFNFEGTNGFAFPTGASYGFGDPDVGGKNTQLGVYIQDDWSPTSRLTFNFGIRWDYETGMYNTSYVTPQAVRDSITAAAGTLFIPIDPNRYFTDGTQRRNFKGAFQPRLGFSYALDESGKTSIFGSFGIFYDRTIFNSFIDESYRR